MMKSVVLLLTGGFLVLGIAFQSTAQNQTEDEKAAINQRIELEIEGMACSICEQNCKTSLEEVDGVNVESISASEGVARLTYTGTEPISDKTLKETVEQTGYKLKKVRRDVNKGSGAKTDQ